MTAIMTTETPGIAQTATTAGTVERKCIMLISYMVRVIGAL